MAKRKKLTKAQRQQIHSMFNGHCAYCGCEIKLNEMQVDHIQSLERGGEDELYNMYPACRSCNHRKHTLTLEGFRIAIQDGPKVLMHSNVTYRNLVRFGVIAHPQNPKVEFYFEKIKKS